MRYLPKHPHEPIPMTERQFEQLRHDLSVVANKLTRAFRYLPPRGEERERRILEMRRNIAWLNISARTLFDSVVDAPEATKGAQG